MGTYISTPNPLEKYTSLKQIAGFAHPCIIIYSVNEEWNENNADKMEYIPMNDVNIEKFGNLAYLSLFSPPRYRDKWLQHFKILVERSRYKLSFDL